MFFRESSWSRFVMAFSPKTSTNLTKNSLFAIKNVDRAHQVERLQAFGGGELEELSHGSPGR